MSSVLKSFSQIPVRAKYMIGLGAPASVIPNTNVGNGGVSGFILAPADYLALGSLATEAAVLATPSYFGSVTIGIGRLFKDMGRQITVLDVDEATHLAVYREMQAVDGAANEGVGGGEANGFNANIFLRIWAADGQNVVVARTG